MSAGDVKFIGWTGTTPRYQELPASISYEPITFVAPDELPESVNFIRKKITRRLICYDRDKSAVLQGLQFVDDALTTVSIDANGASQTVNLGGGWKLLAIADSPYATGMSVITVSYTKHAPVAFNFGLPVGLAIDCDAGKISIKYLTHTLEQIDTGSSVCVDLDFRVTGLMQPPGAGRIDWMAYVTQPIARFDLLAGNVVVDSYVMTGDQYAQRSFNITLVSENITIINEMNAGVTTLSGLSEAAADAWIASLRATDAQKQIAVDSALAGYTDDAIVTHTAKYAESVTKRVFWSGGNNYSWAASFRADVEVRGTGTVPDYSAYHRGLGLDAAWTKSGNIIRLVWGGLTIREYDVTGLT